MFGLDSIAEHVPSAVSVDDVHHRRVGKRPSLEIIEVGGRRFTRVSLAHFVVIAFGRVPALVGAGHVRHHHRPVFSPVVQSLVIPGIRAARA